MRWKTWEFLESFMARRDGPPPLARVFKKHALAFQERFFQMRKSRRARSILTVFTALLPRQGGDAVGGSNASPEAEENEFPF